MSSDSDSGSHSSDEELNPAAHAAALKRLKNKDPDFYDFLKENDEKLLEYQASEEEDNEELSGDEVEENEYLDSDISSQLTSLKEEIQNSPNVQVCKKLMSYLKICVIDASGEDEGKTLKVKNGETFNEVMKLCLVELLPALRKVLKFRNKDQIDVSKCKLWKRMSSSIKSYLIDITKMMSVIMEPTSLKFLLKHISGLVIFYQQYSKLSKILIKKMIHLWSTAEEPIRILAFLIIGRLMKTLASDFHSQILKQMYFAYVKNTKFTSITSWPLINFMKRSLCEAYAMNPEVAYEHAFVYLRQLAIHLRNAITMKKKEAYQTVYNWQFIHCLLHWSHLMCVIQDHEPLKTLAYPLIQTMIGTINLIPTIKYVPTRFHLIHSLIELSKETGNFIPISSLILDVLTLMDFNKKATFTKKRINLSCALKASKSQIQESGFKDEVINEVCKLFMDYFAINAHRIGFPELSVPTIVQMKRFLKENKVAKYGQQLKSIVDKLQENSNYISERRKNISLKVTDYEEISKWEKELLQKGTKINSAIELIVPNNEPKSPPMKKKKGAK